MLTQLLDRAAVVLVLALLCYAVFATALIAKGEAGTNYEYRQTQALERIAKALERCE